MQSGILSQSQLCDHLYAVLKEFRVLGFESLKTDNYSSR